MIKKQKFLTEAVHIVSKMFDPEEIKKAELVNELQKGEKSGFIKGFSRESFFNHLHNKHSIKL